MAAVCVVCECVLEYFYNTIDWGLEVFEVKLQTSVSKYSRSGYVFTHMLCPQGPYLFMFFPYAQNSFALI